MLELATDLVFKAWAQQTCGLSANPAVVQASLRGRHYGRIRVWNHGICLNTTGTYFVFNMAFTKGHEKLVRH